MTARLVFLSFECSSRSGWVFSAKACGRGLEGGGEGICLSVFSLVARTLAVMATTCSLTSLAILFFLLKYEALRGSFARTS
jgi:hypothetical protein